MRQDRGLVVTQDPNTPQVLIEGGRESLSALVDWLGNPVEALECTSTPQEGAPAITAFVWHPAGTDRLTIRVHDGALRLEGTAEALMWMAEVVEIPAGGRPYVSGTPRRALSGAPGALPHQRPARYGHPGDRGSWRTNGIAEEPGMSTTGRTSSSSTAHNASGLA